ncbi:MAG: right-handed parallel beta-helix repeat-containing protein [Candidatus Zixiibacteriota bacterium]|nr:MAG: right-handed parallel beta-helix repeat-containing protein [candidate division Zixibacteria bacterium]
MKKSAAILLTALLLVEFASAEVRVPGDHPTIQAAINAAEEGGTVVIGDGTYSGDGNRDIDFKGKNIVLRSENGPEFTIIDCDGSEAEPHCGFYLHSGEDETSEIDGFTITDAYGPDWWDAAVRCEGASPTLRNCIITANNCNGVRYERATLRVYDCVVTENESRGIWVDACGAVVSGCEISFNEDYGVIWNARWYGYEFEMTDCLVRNNGGHGLWLLVGSGLFHVQNCTFVGNRIGAEYEWDFPKAVVSMPTATSTETSTIENCIMAFNEEYGLISHIWAGDVVVSCNDAYGNGIKDFEYVGEEPEDDYGNFSQDPLFCDAAGGDFSISTTSPCAPEHNDCGVLIGAFDPACTETASSEGDQIQLPARFALHQNSPNPFNPVTWIRFDLPRSCHVRLEVIDITGRVVGVPADGWFEAGEHRVLWDARAFASGVYLYRVRADAFTACRKMILVK